MDNIIISVSELLEIAKELSADDMKYVKLTLLEEDDDLPACINFSAIKNKDDSMVVDYEEIDETPNLKF